MSVFGDIEDNAPHGGMNAPADAWSAAASVDDATTGVLSTPYGASEYDDQRLAAQDTSVDPSARGRATTGSGAEMHPARKRKRRLAVEVTVIEQTKKEPIVWFDVQTSLPRFRNTTYKGVRRTHHEMRRFADHLAAANPECFVPALPAASNSFPPGTPEQDEQLRISLQKWFDRVTRSPLLARDEEFLYFVEASHGYVPVVKITPPATGLVRKFVKQFAPPPDDVDALREFRPIAKLVYQYALESRARLERTSKGRRALSTSLTEFGVHAQRLGGNNDTQAAMWGRVGKALVLNGDAESVKAMYEEATYGDAIELTSRDAYIIKETLTNRHLIMRDLIKSQTATREKHERATRLKGSTNISPAKVDEAIVELEDASRLEKRITSTVRRVSDNLVAERQVALGRIEADLLEAIGDYALRFIEQERRTLAAWESARPDVRAADKNGGLSQLGRPVTAPRKHRYSQGYASDDWSDRGSRARDLAEGQQQLPTYTSDSTATSPPASTADTLDRKSAARMLSESIF